MKVNFKEGIRRIVITIITICVIVCLLDSYKIESEFKANTITENLTTGVKVNLNQLFINVVEVKCYPYKQICIIIKDDGSVEQIDGNKKIVTGNTDEKFVSMPTRIEYFYWQLKDFLYIIFNALMALVGYFILEFVICWIIKGFRKE